MAPSGSALSAIHAWLICGSRHRVYSGNSDVRPRRRANPKTVALSLDKLYRPGKSSKPQVEKEMFPLVRMAQSAGRHDTTQGEGRPGLANRCPGLSPAPPLTRSMTSHSDHVPSGTCGVHGPSRPCCLTPSFCNQESEPSQLSSTGIPEPGLGPLPFESLKP